MLFPIKTEENGIKKKKEKQLPLLLFLQEPLPLSVLSQVLSVQAVQPTATINFKLSWLIHNISKVKFDFDA